MKYARRQKRNNAQKQQNTKRIVEDVKGGIGYKKQENKEAEAKEKEEEKTEGKEIPGLLCMELGFFLKKSRVFS